MRSSCSLFQKIKWLTIQEFVRFVSFLNRDLNVSFMKINWNKKLKAQRFCSFIWFFWTLSEYILPVNYKDSILTSSGDVGVHRNPYYPIASPPLQARSDCYRTENLEDTSLKMQLWFLTNRDHSGRSTDQTSILLGPKPKITSCCTIGWPSGRDGSNFPRNDEHEALRDWRIDGTTCCGTVYMIVYRTRRASRGFLDRAGQA
jgi:hypothetical protein